MIICFEKVKRTFILSGGREINGLNTVHIAREFK